ncbi:MAG: acriflavin resistance protein [Bacteroidetes bacterium GWC2_33_15]|nr:MAG: acriflavin resistance protein [Bacteroidetes bacterium GWA2_33_15]OFX50576.1 MAG: acriflavin resistance protein [Bacteroidetes bacterium GWC2_33_15]OFX64113.1 MAG: acriflavin resistance protein [Bacteroidetes bacterium GWB2_32_14]OFX69725.1 MAG: acriflavin resistance protein [Bacteroidetes bacterium GWD2_33_33]HAN19760.1 acriflavin resistance protein [Bacteroidales bacterium]
MNITELSIKRPTLIVVVFATLTFLGIFSYKQLNYELLPNFAMPVITIVTVYPGASPSEVENSVSKKIEDAISTTENIDNIRSFSQENISYVVMEFKPSADADEMIQVVQRKINSIKSQLPENVTYPTITTFGMSDFPIMNIMVSSNLNPTELYDLIKHRISPELNGIKGVGEIILAGGEEREISVNVNAAKLEKYNLSLLQVTQAVIAANADYPTGKIKNTSQQMQVRLSGKYKNLEDLQNLVITNNFGLSPVRLSDVAEVRDSRKELQNINRYNGINMISVMIKKQGDANTVEVSESVRKELSKLEEIYKEQSLKFDVFSDQSVFTLEAADAVIKDLFLAILLVALVMLVFLHSLRNSLIVMVAIPASVITTFVAMYLMDFSLNMMSLLALSLSIGILVDDSIVVIENIHRHLVKGKDRVTASITGRNEIGFTALSITLVDVAVFLPMALARSIMTGVIRQFSLVIVVATLTSLFVSFTLTPLLASRMAKIENLKDRSIVKRFIDWFETLINRFSAILQSTLLWSFKHKTIVLTSAVILFVGSVSLIPSGFIGTEFIDMGDRGEIIIQMELPKYTTLEQTNAAARRVEQLVLTKPEVTSVMAQVGGTSDFVDISSGSNKAEITVKLVPKEKRKYSAPVYTQLIKNELASKIPGVKFVTSIVSPIGGSDQVPIQVAVKCANPDTLTKYGGIVLNEIKKIPGTSDVKLSVGDPNPELLVNIDKQKMADNGLTMDIVGATMQMAYSGNSDAKFRDGEYEYDINIRYDEFNRQNEKDVAGLSFVNYAGQLIRLDQFADISNNTSTPRIERNDRIECQTIYSQVFGRALGDVGNDIKEQLAKIDFPKDVTLSYEGDLKAQSDSFGSLGFALIASIIFVYLLMVALYQSYLYPFVVLFTIPLAIVGALLALALTGQTLSILTLMGLIMLIGLVSKNAILVVDFTNQLKNEGFSTVDALLQATSVRLRPILMTTFSMIIAMFPIALAAGPGSVWKNGLAWVLIGGLSSSLFLSLVIIPVVYYIADKGKVRVSNWFLRFRTI